MKTTTFLLFITILLGVLSCESKKEESKTEQPVAEVVEEEITSIEFAEKSYDFGDIVEGEKVAHKFEFTNTGENNLILKTVKASCGCTASNYSKEAVAPGEKGFVEVIFNSSSRPGPNHKSLTVVANTDPKTTVLTFNVMVNKKE